MKKIIITLIALLLLVPLGAKDLKVLLNSNMQIREFTFLRNYAIVINNDHYYGPISKDVRLKIEAVGDKKLALSLSYLDGKTYKYTSLGGTTSRVDVVQYLDDVDFSKTIDPKVTQTSKKITFTNKMLSQQILKYNTPFFTLKYKTGDEVKLNYKKGNETKKEGTIDFWGIPSFFALSDGSKKFYVVENIALERYLDFTTNCELRKANNVDAYKAQAILARTFALQKTEERVDQYKNHNKTLWKNFQLRPDTRDQAYICTMRVKEADEYAHPSNDVHNSVAQTNDRVLGEDSELLEIYYCAYCGTCSYCTKNNCKATENGRGDCQNGIIDYAKKHNYIETLEHYHKGASLYKYNNGSLKFIQKLDNRKAELEKNLMDVEDRLQHMI